MKTLQALLAMFWIAMLAVTFYAVRALGSEGGMVFLSDFMHPWRAQFNTDFSLHIVLIAIWVFWREKSKALGSICALLCLMGGLFTFLYLLIAVHRAKGNAKNLMLGTHAHA
jgi:uncharacterized membrane protein